VLAVGALVPDKDAGEWDWTVASGFVIHKSGIFVTNFHVAAEKDADTLAVMTSDGRVFPVKAVLAASKLADVAICQIDGDGDFESVALVGGARSGTHVRVLSNPDEALYTLTEGFVSRYSVLREDGNATTVLETTAESAVGSSGGPLFDDRGNVIGMGASTSAVYSDADDPPSDGPGDLQMAVRMCVLAAEILKSMSTSPQPCHGGAAQGKLLHPDGFRLNVAETVGHRNPDL
jgi:serine protease Do